MSSSIRSNKSEGDRNRRNLRIISSLIQKDDAGVISEIRHIHEEICDASGTAEEYFAIQMVTIIAIMFIIVIFNGYFLAEILFGCSVNDITMDSISIVAFLAYQLLLHAIGLLVIVHASNAVTTEV